MKTFKIQAIDKKGGIHHLERTDLSEANCRLQLEKEGLCVLKLRSRFSFSALFKLFSFEKSPFKKSKSYLALITQQLSALIQTGTTIEEAFLSIIKQAPPKERFMLEQIRQRMIEGHPLAESLEAFPAVFSPTYLAAIRAGEKTGKMAYILERLANYTEEQRHIQNRIQEALIYPILMTTISFIIVFFLLTHILPSMLAVFEDSGQALPLATRCLIGLSHFLSKASLPFLSLAIIGYIAFKKALKNERFRWAYDKSLLKIPGIRYMIITHHLTHYCQTLSLLLSSGVPILQAMKNANSLFNNRVLKKAMEEALQSLSQGQALHLCLIQTNLFSPILIQLIASGERSGKIAEMLNYGAHIQNTEMKKLIDTGLKLLEPGMILIMGGVVLFIVLAILLPIFSMNNMVNF